MRWERDPVVRRSNGLWSARAVKRFGPDIVETADFEDLTAVGATRSLDRFLAGEVVYPSQETVFSVTNDPAVRVP